MRQGIKKVATIRDGTTERFQLSFIGALGIVIVLFVLMGNTKFKAYKTHSTPPEILIVEDLLINEDILKPPKVEPPKAFSEAMDGETPDPVLPTDNFIDPDIPIGEDVITNVINSIKFLPVGATPPVIQSDISIRYPKVLQAQGIEGFVIVLVYLDEQGNILHAEIAKTSGYADFDKEALNAIKQSSFRPAMQGDRPIKVKVTVPVRFSLQ